MAKLDNRHHEAFAQYVSEGKTSDEAYALAYDRERSDYTRMAGARLIAKDSVKVRVSELQERHARQTDVTVERVTQMLLEDRLLAHGEGQSGAAVSASMGLAKLHGLIIDKKESGRPGEFDGRSTDELRRELARYNDIAAQDFEGTSEQGSPEQADTVH